MEAKAKKDDHRLMVQLLKHNSKRSGQSQVEHPFKQFKSDNKPTNKRPGLRVSNKMGTALSEHKSG